MIACLCYDIVHSCVSVSVYVCLSCVSTLCSDHVGNHKAVSNILLTFGLLLLLLLFIINQQTTNNHHDYCY